MGGVIQSYSKLFKIWGVTFVIRGVAGAKEACSKQKWAGSVGKITRFGAWLRLEGWGQAVLPGFWSRQDPQDVCLLVSCHPFQPAALDGDPRAWLPLESVAHVHVELRLTSGR